MSKHLNIYLRSNETLEIKTYLGQLAERQKLQNLINYYESLEDEVNLNCN
jgi:hypothetical protein